MSLEPLLRELAPQVLGTLVRRHGQFDACEDAVQEALLAASQQWPLDGVPDQPRSWLVTVAQRRLIDEWRSESARRRREQDVAALEVAGEAVDADDTLALLFLCCHPSLKAPSQLALTLRAVGGLTTQEIARAMLVPEATMAQRISRAKASIRASDLRFDLPTDDLLPRLEVVLRVLYLIFNEGYVTSSGDSVLRADLTEEALRLTRLLHRLLPQPEVAGLLALMLLTEARREARTNDGELVALADQDRSRWDRDLIAEGVALISSVLGTAAAGPYQLQAAIAAVHDEAATAAETDWAQILALYEVLEVVAPGPVVTLNRAVAVAQVRGPLAGLALLGTLEGDARLALSHRIHVVRAHLLEEVREVSAARAAYQLAARMTLSRPEQRYLTLKAAALTD